MKYRALQSRPCCLDTNVALQTEIFVETPVVYPWYRVTYTGTGTMAAIISGKAYFKGRL